MKLSNLTDPTAPPWLLPNPGADIVGFSFLTDSEFASIALDGEVRLWRLSEPPGEPRTLHAGAEPIDAVAFGSWYLEEYGDDGQPVRRHPLRTLPFLVGRGTDADAVLAYPHVSSEHAQIVAREGRLWLRDLQSSNGTFKNGEKVGEAVPLREGDVLHFAHVEVLVGHEAAAPAEGATIVRIGTAIFGERI